MYFKRSRWYFDDFVLFFITETCFAYEFNKYFNRRSLFIAYCYKILLLKKTLNI